MGATAPNPAARQTLDEAATAICGARAGDYGAAIENFECIAALWTARGARRWPGQGIEFNADDVGAMMRLLKEARLVNTPGHKDSLVDIAGYAALNVQTTQDVRDRRKPVSAGHQDGFGPFDGGA